MPKTKKIEERYAAREARQERAAAAWVKNIRRPYWSPDLPDGQDLRAVAAVDSEIERLKTLGQVATRVKKMTMFSSKKGIWQHFRPPSAPAISGAAPLPQRPTRAAKDQAKTRLEAYRPRTRKAITVSNLRGCAFIIAFSRNGMRAVHVWEDLLDFHDADDGTTIMGLTSGQTIGRGHGIESIQQYCEKYITKLFARHREQLKGGRVVVVLPHHIFAKFDFARNKWIGERGYRYDMRYGVVATRGDYPRYPGNMRYGLATSSFVLIEGIPEMIMWSAAQGTGLKQLKRGFREVADDAEEAADGTKAADPVDLGLRSGRKRRKTEPVEQNFFEASYVPWNILDVEKFEGPSPPPAKMKGTVVALYEPEYEIKEGKGKGSKCNRVQVWVDGRPVFNKSGKRPWEEFRWTW